MYTTLFIDADETLFDFTRAEQNALSLLLREFCGIPSTPALQSAYHTINEQLWRAFEKQKLTRAELLSTRFALFFKACGIEKDPIAANRFYLSALANESILIDGAFAVCETLSQTHTLYLLTNGVTDVQRRRLAASALAPLIKRVYVSEETGSQKPQKAYFDYVFDDLASRGEGVSRAQVLMVGDSLTSDIQGGINAGIDTCWYHPHVGENTSEWIPTYHIRRLEELIDLA